MFKELKKICYQTLKILPRELRVQFLISNLLRWLNIYIEGHRWYLPFTSQRAWQRSVELCVPPTRAGREKAAHPTRDVKANLCWPRRKLWLLRQFPLAWGHTGMIRGGWLAQGSRRLWRSSGESAVHKYRQVLCQQWAPHLPPTLLLDLLSLKINPNTKNSQQPSPPSCRVGSWCSFGCVRIVFVLRPLRLGKRDFVGGTTGCVSVTWVWNEEGGE